MKKIIFAFFCIICSLYAEEDFLIETEHQITLGGLPVSYSASAGTLPLKDENDKVKAHIFFISYVRNDLLPNDKRPIFFCFNGGPGCPSIWLHLGLLGPKKIQIDEKKPYLPPYTL